MAKIAGNGSFYILFAKNLNENIVYAVLCSHNIDFYRTRSCMLAHQ